MCGRFSLALAADIINGKLGVEVPSDYKPSWNIAPTQKAAIILNTQPEKIEMVKWGLIPAWSLAQHNKGFTMINARAETLGEKATFRGLLNSRRCVVVADGFYEWKRVGDEKQPYRIVPANDGLFLIAGLWTEVKQDNGEILRTFTIITTTPNKKMEAFHDRMPVILESDEAKSWLAGDDTELDPLPDDRMETFAVSSAVNNPRNNAPEVALPKV